MKLRLGDNFRVMVTRIDAFRGEIDIDSVQTSESSASQTPALAYRRRNQFDAMLLMSYSLV